MDLQRTAAVLIDMQEDVVRGRWWTWWPDIDGVVESCKSLVGSCRSLGLPVLYTAVEYRADGSNTPQALAGGGASPTEYLVEGTPGVGIIPSLRPEPGELVAVKNLVSAFDAVGFAETIERLDVRHLLVAGLAAEGGVLATVRDGHERGLDVVVLDDCCAAFGEASWKTHLEATFPPLARVCSTTEALASLD